MILVIYFKMFNLFRKWTLSFYDPSHESQYQEKFNVQRLYFFRSSLALGFFVLFISMLVFIIQDAQIYIVILIAILMIAQIILLFFSKQLQPYLKNILTLMFVSYVAGGALITYVKDNMQIIMQFRPLYNYGYSCSLLFQTLIQYCDFKHKPLFIFSSACISLGLFVEFSVDQLPYIVFSILMTFIQGIMTHLFEYIHQDKNSHNKLQSNQSFMNLFKIHYLHFELEFVNKAYESSFQKEHNGNQFKEFLRTYTIGTNMCDNSNSIGQNKQFHKQLNLEEYLYDLINNEKLGQDQNNICIQAIGDEGILNIEIARVQYQRSILILIIRKNQVRLQIQKYESNIKALKLKFQEALILIGKALEDNYLKLNELDKSLDIDNETLRKQYCNIQFSLNFIKNHLIYLQKGKMSFLKQQIEQLTIDKLNRALSNYFIHYCQLHSKKFELDCPGGVEQQKLYLNARLLTQLLINCFNKIIKISETHSVIQLKINQKVEKKLNFIPDLNLISFSYIFEHKNQIDNMESQFYQQINPNSQDSFEIECIVNQIILNILGPYNIISTESFFQENQQNYKTTLKFLIYTDQTQLDPSYTKYIQISNLDN
ncbi:unnamed protein product (macronuclear) [Paramecium tetraurelia]|uniref:Transmembrane protein n=1 Tax=Paramecium tetraurelia TaxID=5888 RepID=A0BEH0_PARTE|nr:uncharacterized protein GSPATT00027970001 [Paramecium tetraurelia]CAK56937.1 unnamed protein product [Paramecium tetraurelia]|eukprot:XP_001424335.1 hypothetical protein (macronuclear) [Paramecium tetraurelia strain d4-2]